MIKARTILPTSGAALKVYNILAGKKKRAVKKREKGKKKEGKYKN